MPNIGESILSDRMSNQELRMAMDTNEKRTLKVDARGVLDGATVSSVAWGAAGTVTVSSETESSGVATAMATANYAGCDHVRATITLSDGRVFTQDFLIGVGYDYSRW